jgi:hypothetical protein
VSPIVIGVQHPVGGIARRQTSFIALYDGELIAHPALAASTMQKGYVRRMPLASLGGGFAELPLADLIAGLSSARCM